MTTHCPTCERACAPVYCRASTDDAPLLLAYTVTQAARRLGIAPAVLYANAEPWRGGWRLRRKRKEAA